MDWVKRTVIIRRVFEEIRALFIREKIISNLNGIGRRSFMEKNCGFWLRKSVFLKQSDKLEFWTVAFWFEWECNWGWIYKRVIKRLISYE